MDSTLADVINNSGDSLLETYAYANGRLTVELVLGENDRRVALSMPTARVAFDSAHLSSEEATIRMCAILVEDLAQVLTVANGVYTPAPGFGRFMQEARANYALAYGQKASEWTCLFSLVGYGRLVSCLSADRDAVIVAGMAE
jgi:hypothetical protein